MKIKPRFGISSLLCFVLICGASFAWLRPFEPDVRLSNVGVEQRHTLKGEIVRLNLVVSNKSYNTLWIAANERGVIPNAVMLTATINRDGEAKRVNIPYDMYERSEPIKWHRVSPYESIELYAEVPEVTSEVTISREFWISFHVHDWRGRTAEVRTPVITAPEIPSSPTSQK